MMIAYGSKDMSTVVNSELPHLNSEKLMNFFMAHIWKYEYM